MNIDAKPLPFSPEKLCRNHYGGWTPPEQAIRLLRGEGLPFGVVKHTLQGKGEGGELLV